jgi:Protein of unknown function (DUF3891)
MLLRHEDEDRVVTAIGQASHAWISGQFARAWSPRPEPFEQVALAAEQHDVGMAEWDLRPTLNPDTGLPHSFLELPVPTHIGLWERAPYKLLTQSRYAALLVSMHGTALQGLRDLEKLGPTDRALVEAYLAGQRKLRERLIGQLAADREQLARNQRLVWAWDSFSLALCLDWETTTDDGIELTRVGRHRFTFSPWPLTTPEVHVYCEGRRLHGRFDTERELHDALANAPTVDLRFTVTQA